MSASAIPIPVISLQEHDNHPSLGSAIFAACTTSGFFYLSDHGLDPNLVDAVFEASRAFFLEDGEGVEEVKRAYADRESNTVSVRKGQNKKK